MTIGETLSKAIKENKWIEISYLNQTEYDILDCHKVYKWQRKENICHIFQ